MCVNPSNLVLIGIISEIFSAFIYGVVLTIATGIVEIMFSCCYRHESDCIELVYFYSNFQQQNVIGDLY